MLQEILFDRNMFRENLAKYSQNAKHVTLNEFVKFLEKEQAETPERNNVALKMMNYLQVCFSLVAIWYIHGLSIHR